MKKKKDRPPVKQVVKTKIKIPQNLLGEKIETLAEWIEQKYPAVSNAVAVALRVKFTAGMTIHWKGATSIERSYSIGYNALFNLMRDWGVMLDEVPELGHNKQFVKFYKKKVGLIQDAMVINYDNQEKKDKVKPKDKSPS